MLEWKINGQTFAQRELSNVTRQCSNMATDRLTFTAPSRPIDATPIFDYDTPVTVTRSGQPFFTGRAARVPITGTPQSESHTYEILGPWDQLERTTFQQRWQSGQWVGETWIPELRYKSRCILGQGESGQALTVGQVILEVIQYAAGCGITIAPGLIQGGPYFPWDEIVDLTCAEVIRRVARWMPESVGWFDYTQSPPRFNFLPRSSLTPAILSIGSSITNITLTPMGARSVPSVILKWEQTSEVNGQPILAIYEDKYPQNATGREIGAVIQTLQLAGGQVTNMAQKQSILSRPFPTTDDTWLQWFLKKAPAYADPQNPLVIKPKYENFRFTLIEQRTQLPYELIEGSLQDWMRQKIPDPTDPTGTKLINNHDHKYSFLDADDTITLSFAYETYNERREKLIIVADETVSINVKSTDCPSGKYTRLIGSAINGEQVPQGLAQYLYESLNTTHYAGTVERIEEEVSGSISVGQLLRITGGAPGWSTMTAIIQSIQENLDTGRTLIQVGPPSHLTPSDILDLRRCNRARRVSTSNSSRSTGQAGSGAVEIGSAHPVQNVSSTPGDYAKSIQVITDVRFDTSTNQLQKQLTRITAMHAEDPGEWSMIEGGQAEDCDQGVE